MLENQKISFWAVVVGILMIGLGGFVWMNPVSTIIGLALYLGIVFLVSGIGYIVTSFSVQSGWVLAEGLLNLLVGLIFICNLGISTASLPIMFAFWAMFVGIMQLVTSYQMKQLDLPRWGWVLFTGILGILIAMMIIAYPLIGVFAITTMMGTYLVIYGVLAIALYITNR